LRQEKKEKENPTKKKEKKNQKLFSPGWGGTASSCRSGSGAAGRRTGAGTRGPRPSRARDWVLFCVDFGGVRRRRSGRGESDEEENEKMRGGIGFFPSDALRCSPLSSWILSLSLPSSLFFFHSAAPCRNLGVRELLLEARPRGAPKPDARRRRVELEALLLVADGIGARARVRSRSQRGVARDSGSGVRDCSDRVRKDPRWGRRSSKSSTSSRRLRRGRVHCAAKKVETFFFGVKRT